MQDLPAFLLLLQLGTGMLDALSCSLHVLIRRFDTAHNLSSASS